jgi:hypothetical protein
MLNNNPNPISKKDLNFVVEHAHPKTHYTLMNMRELGIIESAETRGFYIITDLGRAFYRLIRKGFVMCEVIN